jgi:hypothetical protein
MRAVRCGELSTGEYHAQYERSSGSLAGWVCVWTGGLEARQGVGTQDWGSPYTAPYTTLKQNSKPSSINAGVRGWGSTHRASINLSIGASLCQSCPTCRHGCRPQWPGWCARRRARVKPRPTGTRVTRLTAFHSDSESEKSRRLFAATIQVERQPDATVATLLFLNTRSNFNQRGARAWNRKISKTSWR